MSALTIAEINYEIKIKEDTFTIHGLEYSILLKWKFPKIELRIQYSPYKNSSRPFFFFCRKIDKLLLNLHGNIKDLE